MRETNWVRRERLGDRENKPSAIETLEEIADRLAKQITDNPCSHPSCCPRTAGVKADILSALRNERARALRDAARQECVFCAGVAGYNPTPVQAMLPIETDIGNYIHRNDPPYGLAGVYCKAPRINDLIHGPSGKDSKPS